METFSVLVYPLCGQSTGYRCIPLTKGQWCQAWMFSLMLTRTNFRRNDRFESSDLGRLNYKVMSLKWGVDHKYLAEIDPLFLNVGCQLTSFGTTVATTTPSSSRISGSPSNGDDVPTTEWPSPVLAEITRGSLNKMANQYAHFDYCIIHGGKKFEVMFRCRTGDKPYIGRTKNDSVYWRVCESSSLNSTTGHWKVTNVFLDMLSK